MTEANHGEIMDGISWLADVWRSHSLNVTLARGVGPEGLVVRLGATSATPFGHITAAEAFSMTGAEGSARVARFGECGEWSFAVEPICPSAGWWGRPQLSAGGVEVLHLTPKGYDPPSEVWYYRDGITVDRFNIGEIPDGGMEFLAPEFEEAGLVDDPLMSDQPEDFDAVRATLKVLEEHFGLSLPRRAVLEERLPAVVTATKHPEDLGA
ncbi:hypothetical protein ABZ829_00535 [Streptomyces xanthochromogenes]|uniref:hypothetical protein n=1 Tax=Streptomyces xanthochromogenes TaxID=67384 RepID=UPI003416D3D4